MPESIFAHPSVEIDRVDQRGEKHETHERSGDDQQAVPLAEECPEDQAERDDGESDSTDSAGSEPLVAGCRARCPGDGGDDDRESEHRQRPSRATLTWWQRQQRRGFDCRVREIPGERSDTERIPGGRCDGGLADHLGRIGGG